MIIRNKKCISILIKTLIILCSFGYIYKQIFYKSDFTTVLIEFRDTIENAIDYTIVTIVLLLMLINWSLETYKWQYLIKKIEKIGFFKALKGVLTGVTVSILTPNRVGEFGGRIFVLERGNRIKAILITMIGSMCQLLITIITGSLSLLYFVGKYFRDGSDFNNYAFFGLIFITLVLVVFITILFFNLRVLFPLLNKIKIFAKFRKYSKVFYYYKFRELLKVFLISLIRYFVFSLQYYLILYIFDVNIPFIEGMLMISIIFFVISVIPTIALIEVGIRGSVALYFISYLLNSPIPAKTELGILTSSFVIWLINLVIPAIAGIFFVPDLKFFRKS
ncbi:MAG: lysylphosphatidylglycerol synthase domain-containing protein [Bacteroidota bacterium]|nr:lysylphosphatidylglycerol synthase domain-containing protein [Bacteroidota bacterium]